MQFNSFAKAAEALKMPRSTVSKSISRLEKEGVRVGPVRDSGLKLKRAGEVILILVASATYLKGKEKIRVPKDILQHQCLSLNLPQTARRWSLRSSEKTIQVPIQAKVLCNQMNSLLSMALTDGGIALVPTYICQPHLDSGKLVRVLPEWSSFGWPISLISPLAPSSSARLKTTVDGIFEELKLKNIL